MINASTCAPSARAGPRPPGPEHCNSGPGCQGASPAYDPRGGRGGVAERSAGEGGGVGDAEPGAPPLGDSVFRALADASAAITFIYQGERNVYANAAAE